MDQSPISWRDIQKKNFFSLEKLAIFLELNHIDAQRLFLNKNFSLNLPLRLAKKIKKGTLDDPILLQFVPLKEEALDLRGVLDPVGDLPARRSARCIHKYPRRVLMIATGACAMHCRFCFRQHFDYPSSDINFLSEIAHVAQDNSLDEIILSGGDPLSLNNQTLKQALDLIDSISHIKRVRFHTRFPIGIPERIDNELLQFLSKRRVQIWFVIHCNHPLELDEDVRTSLKQIQCLGIPILCQTVLLKGVNDSIEVLENLCIQLINAGIQPYYLHQLDPVKGASHFEVDPSEGKRLVAALNKKLSGYGIPKYVQDLPHQSSKTLLH